MEWVWRGRELLSPPQRFGEALLDFRCSKRVQARKPKDPLGGEPRSPCRLPPTFTPALPFSAESLRTKNPFEPLRRREQLLDIENMHPTYTVWAVVARIPFERIVACLLPNLFLCRDTIISFYFVCSANVTTTDCVGYLASKCTKLKKLFLTAIR